jgi:hypothetical protein
MTLYKILCKIKQILIIAVNKIKIKAKILH